MPFIANIMLRGQVWIVFASSVLAILSLVSEQRAKSAGFCDF